MIPTPKAPIMGYNGQGMLAVARAAANGVFISYSRADELFALELAERLRGLCSARVWLDITDIPDSGDWRAEIKQALERCGVMLYILPSESEDRDQHWERRVFRKAGKVIIPILGPDSAMSGAYSQLEPINLRDSWHDLRRLCRYLGGQSA